MGTVAKSVGRSTETAADGYILAGTEYTTDLVEVNEQVEYVLVKQEYIAAYEHVLCNEAATMSSYSYLTSHSWGCHYPDDSYAPS